MLSAFADGRLFGERYADGPVEILALHGWGRSRRDFAATLEGLPAVALDLPGFGSSPPPPEEWGSRRYADEVAVAAEELLGRQAQAAGAARSGRGLVVLGHSFGGDVAVQLAAARPELVGGLVLTGTPRLVSPSFRGLPPARPKPAFRLLRAARRAGLVSETVMERARQRYGSADYRAASGVMRGVLVRVLAEDLEPELRELACPLRLVWGEQDGVVPLAGARRAAELLGTAASLEVLPGVGHLVPLEAPAALRSALEQMVGRRDAGVRAEQP